MSAKPILSKKPPTKPIPTESKTPAPQKIKKLNLFTRANDFVVSLSGVPLEEKLFFIEHLKVLVHAGLSLSDSLGTLSEQTENKHFAK